MHADRVALLELVSVLLALLGIMYASASGDPARSKRADLCMVAASYVLVVAAYALSALADWMIS